MNRPLLLLSAVLATSAATSTHAQRAASPQTPSAPRSSSSPRPSANERDCARARATGRACELTLDPETVSGAGAGTLYEHAAVWQHPEKWSSLIRLRRDFVRQIVGTAHDL
jgi:hypothetical protein